MTDNNLPRFLKTEQVGAHIQVPAATLRYWRHIGYGPKSFKVGRRVLYALEDVEAWLAAARSGVGA
jgi:DNA-binding transcriptional MerR regulator